MAVLILLVLLGMTIKSEATKRAEVDNHLWTTCSLTCGGGIQQMKAKVSRTRACNTLHCEGDAGCVCEKLSFDLIIDKDVVYDMSFTRNMGKLHGKAKIVDGGIIKQCLDLQEGGYVSLNAENFHNRPDKALSVAAWVKLPTVAGTRTVFHTYGNDKGYNQGEYILELMDGFVRWIHTDALGNVIFLLASKSQIPCGIWTHVMVTYKGPEGEVKMYINGENNLTPITIPQDPSLNHVAMDWREATLGVIGQNTNPLQGFIDEFRIYKCAITDEEVKELYTNGSIKKFEIPYHPFQG